MSVMSQTYSIIIDRGISAPGHGKEVVDGINAVDKRYIYQLMSKVQLTGSVLFDSQIKIHTGTENKDVSLAHELKIIWKKSTAKMVPSINENKEKYSWKENGQKENIMFRIMLRWNSKM